MPDSDHQTRGHSRYTKAGAWLLEATENAVYIGISGLLAIVAAVLLVAAGRQVITLVASPSQIGGLEVLDTLLLIFIIVELLFSVRTTLAKRELVAEPFLLVGIIASIKEIVVLGVKAADNAGKGAVFRDQVIEIAVLGVIVLILGVTSFLLRRKEREPEEGGSRVETGG